MCKRPHSYLRMPKITSALNETVNLFPRSFSTSRQPRFPIKGFKFWRFGCILATFSHIFTAHAIYEFPVKILTPEFDFLTPISLHGTIFRRLEDVFC